MNKFEPKITPEDTLLTAYRYDLPEELIAQSPPVARGSSRLLVHDRKTGANTPTAFTDLVRFLPPGVIIINNSKVLPARILGRRETGGKVEFLLMTPLPHIKETIDDNGVSSAEVECLIKSSKKVRIGESFVLAENLQAIILDRGEYGKCIAKIRWRGDLSESIAYNGVLPLPPYIKRPASADDALRYQTVYARPEKTGSIAAPTAGLHFTEEMLGQLREAGYTFAEVTLYVGYGTFSPVRCENIREHVMHSEYCEVPERTAEIIARAKADGIPVTAVGTTAARTLEGVAAQKGIVEPFRGWTDVFLYPGKPVRVVDHLLTNFHLPESTLLMLVAALAGREAMLDAYRLAVAERFRFFSYGDAMLIV
jgi:S-adenosylmethionine:tRNA ribosyltransferase-isomerase